MTEVITDAADPRLDDFRDLVNTAERRRYESAHQFVIAEGMPLIARLITRHRARAVAATPRMLGRTTAHLPSSGPPALVVDDALLSSVVGFEFRRGIIASFVRPALVPPEHLMPASAVVVLAGLNDSENVGAIYRAAALGVEGALIDERCADPFYRRSVRVSMGSVLDIPSASTEDLPGAIRELGRAGFTTIAMTTRQQARPITDIEPLAKAALVLGSEADGLDEEVIGTAQLEVTIKTSALVDSLNVGHAAAIAFHSLIAGRQR